MKKWVKKLLEKPAKSGGSVGSSGSVQARVIRKNER